MLKLAIGKLIKHAFLEFEGIYPAISGPIYNYMEDTTPMQVKNVIMETIGKKKKPRLLNIGDVKNV